MNLEARPIDLVEVLENSQKLIERKFYTLSAINTKKKKIKELEEQLECLRIDLKTDMDTISSLNGSIENTFVRVIYPAVSQMKGSGNAMWLIAILGELLHSGGEDVNDD